MTTPISLLHCADYKLVHWHDSWFTCSSSHHLKQHHLSSSNSSSLDQECANWSLVFHTISSLGWSYSDGYICKCCSRLLKIQLLVYVSWSQLFCLVVLPHARYRVIFKINFVHLLLCLFRLYVPDISAIPGELRELETLVWARWEKTGDRQGMARRAALSPRQRAVHGRCTLGAGPGEDTPRCHSLPVGRTSSVEEWWTRITRKHTWEWQGEETGKSRTLSIVVQLLGTTRTHVRVLVQSLAASRPIQLPVNAPEAAEDGSST